MKNEMELMPATLATPAESLIAQGQVVVQAKTKFMTAVGVQKERNIAKVIRYAEDCTQQMESKDVYYNWTVSNTDGSKGIVEGPAVGLASVVQQAIGNNISDVEIEQETETHWYFKAYYIDLETGANTTRLFRQLKNKKMGKYDPERLQDMQFQIGQSKAHRNVICHANRWLVNHLMNAKKKTENDKVVKNLVKYKDAAIKTFGEKGINREQLEDLVGKSLALWTADDIVHLQGINNGIDTGEMTQQEIFGIVKPKDREGDIKLTNIIPTNRNSGGSPTEEKGLAPESEPGVEIADDTLTLAQAALDEIPEALFIVTRKRLGIKKEINQLTDEECLVINKEASRIADEEAAND